MRKELDLWLLLSHRPLSLCSLRNCFCLFWLLRRCLGHLHVPVLPPVWVLLPASPCFHLIVPPPFWGPCKGPSWWSCHGLVVALCHPRPWGRRVGWRQRRTRRQQHGQGCHRHSPCPTDHRSKPTYPTHPLPLQDDAPGHLLLVHQNHASSIVSTIPRIIVEAASLAPSRFCCREADNGNSIAFRLDTDS